MKIAVLGCGPAGLLIAHAARLCGHTPFIFSKKQISPMRGAQYQHVKIPEIGASRPQTLSYTLIGSIEGYREKVYGSGDPDVVVSPEEFVGVHRVWDLRATYGTLWKLFGPSVINVEVDQKTLSHVTEYYDMVFSTIPAPTLCRHQKYKDIISVGSIHQFKYREVWVDELWHGPVRAIDVQWNFTRNLVICNGFPNVKWYRTSDIYGHVNTEWVAPNDVTPGHVHCVKKPLSTNCNCWPSIVRAGRYGSWTKGVLTHHAFQEAMDILA
jgi:hypothetical protein